MYLVRKHAINVQTMRGIIAMMIMMTGMTISSKTPTENEGRNMHINIIQNHPDSKPADSHSFFVCLFKHNHTPRGKKTMTGMQVVTTSKVQIAGCRSKAILSCT